MAKALEHPQSTVRSCWDEIEASLLSVHSLLEHLEISFKSNIVIACNIVPFYWTLSLLPEGDTSNHFTEELKGRETLTDNGLNWVPFPVSLPGAEVRPAV